MKTLTTLFLTLVLCTVAYAQDNQVTKFLGIPIDGTKSGMIQKLRAKGFTYNSSTEGLEGTFNGERVTLYVVTNNSKVYRIAVIPKQSWDEGQIKIKYNNQLSQFIDNGKYCLLSHDSIDNVDLDYQMFVKNEVFQTAMIQLPGSINDPTFRKKVEDAYLSNFKSSTLDKEYESITNMDNPEIFDIACMLYARNYRDNIVWFTIDREGYNRYSLLIYHDNTKNKAHGEDL